MQIDETQALVVQTVPTLAGARAVALSIVQQNPPAHADISWGMETLVASMLQTMQRTPAEFVLPGTVRAMGAVATQLRDIAAAGVPEHRPSLCIPMLWTELWQLPTDINVRRSAAQRLAAALYVCHEGDLHLAWAGRWATLYDAYLEPPDAAKALTTACNSFG